MHYVKTVLMKNTLTLGILELCMSVIDPTVDTSLQVLVIGRMSGIEATPRDGSECRSIIREADGGGSSKNTRTNEWMIA